MKESVISSPADLELLHRAKSGDFLAFQELVELFQPRVYGLCMRILRQNEDAEDATQQTFLAFIEHIEDFREESSLATWLLKIATNNSLKVLRKKRGIQFEAMFSSEEDSYSSLPHPDFIAPWTETADNILQRAELREEINEALGGLDEKYRTVFVLRDVEGFSVRETAEALN